MATNKKWYFVNVPFNKQDRDDMALVERLQREAEALEISRSAVVRQIVSEHYQNEHQPKRTDRRKPVDMPAEAVAA